MALDPDQTAAKLIVQRASASAGYKGVAGSKVGLCTSTYKHSQDDATKSEIARRVAAMGLLATALL